MSIKQIFPSTLYEAALFPKSAQAKLHKQIRKEADDLMNLDRAGIAWSKDFYRNGYTSYASANQLQRQSSTFATLEEKIDKHVAKFCRHLGFKLGGTKLKMSTCWINVMPPNTHHSLHIHPLSVISGTYYVQIPTGASAIRFEDPRLDRFMNSPPRQSLQYSLTPNSGKVVLFESWLRHEVPTNTTKTPRISVSFNYEWT